ncbi:hypothetical protein E2C01_015107 [Portunus trituberculatus]|uniref:Uncharacterized protein n=1 Tax=Portunus trituberculatus TaxID=210409 RepID=A0A5B7DKF7_PORTR|nr:hypothetical protein [Portunus trituberculatus]
MRSAINALYIWFNPHTEGQAGESNQRASQVSPGNREGPQLRPLTQECNARPLDSHTRRCNINSLQPPIAVSGAPEEVTVVVVEVVISRRRDRLATPQDTKAEGE